VTPGYKDNYNELTRDILDQKTVDWLTTGIKASVDQTGQFTIVELPDQYWTIKTVSTSPPPFRSYLSKI
jgi:hypothetical protein